jgi:glycerophosphoryl diester phosphodiesterase
MGVVALQINNGVIGHRGASAYAPENTLAAFNKALALGCNFIEFDVMLSADGEPFVFHDDSLKRTTNGKGDLGRVDAGYLLSLDAGKWFSKDFRGEKIPHFREVLQWLTFAGISANIEIKPYRGTARQTAVAVMTYLTRYWPHTREMPLVSSFDKEALYLCRELAPELPLGLLLHVWEDDWSVTANDLQCYSLHVNRRILNASRVKAIKDAGYKLYAYTVNSQRQAKKLLGWGVDAVFSDYPDLMTS